MRNGFLFFLLLLSLRVSARNEFRARLLSPANGIAEKYGTVEIGVQSPETNRLFSNFSTGKSPGLNPYDPKNFNVQAQFICHGKTYSAELFYYEDHRADSVSNRYETSPSEWPWRIRFSPPDTGSWQLLLLTGDAPMQVPHGTGVVFTCVPSRHKGWLEVAPDKRHLCFRDDKSSFFAIGQNIGWVDEPVLRGHIVSKYIHPSGYFDIDHDIADLGKSGGNYVRIIMAPWSTGIEWEQAGVYHQGRAAALDSMLSVAEKYNMYIHLCIEIPGLGTGDDPYSWNNNPYHKALHLQDMCELLTNDSAVKLFEQRMHYIEARWGYSPNVAVIELLSEMDGWAGYKTHQQDFVNWHTKIVNYLHVQCNDTMRLFTSCFSAPPYGKLFGTGAMQTTSLHNYNNNFYTDRHRYYLVNGRNLFYPERRGIHRRFDKPCIFGEMGLTNYGADAGDLESCNDVSFHNDLWATTFMGCFGAGLNWWAWNNDAYRENNFPALCWFIDSACAGLQGFVNYNYTSGNGLEVFYSGKTRDGFVAGWLHNTSYWWGNMSDSCTDRNGKTMILPKDDDRFSAPQERSGETIRLNGFHKKTLYTFTMYDTRVAGKKIFTGTVASNRRGQVKISLPKDVPGCAFTIVRTFVGDF